MPREGSKMVRTIRKMALGVGLALVGFGGAQAETWSMQSSVPGSIIQLGTYGKRIAEQVTLVTDGEITMEFHEPGSIVPALEVFKAVGDGTLDAGYSSPGFVVPAMQLFASVPFGPRASEYLAWLKFGGGKEILEELYHDHGVHGITCAVIAPEASGWFVNEINDPKDLQGLKMRIFGLGAKVVEKLGVSTRSIAGGEILAALESGEIDAAEFSMPAVDLNLEFFNVAKHYYFPGWHQQSTFSDLMINLERWQRLDEDTRRKIEIVCDANIAHGLAEGEAIQFQAIDELRRKGVSVHNWSPEMMAAFERAWNEVVEEEIAKDEDFARIWASLQNFREMYRNWERLGYVQ